MALWGKTDNAANTPAYALSQVNLTQNSGNQSVLFGNVTPNAIVSGATVGQFCVDAAEAGVSSGNVVALEILSSGSGYTANAVVTLTGGGGASATADSGANSVGKIANLTITAAGSSYESSPDVVIAAPSAKSFIANTAVAANGFITLTTPVFAVGDYLLYTVSSGNTALAQLTSGTSYYVQAANTTGVYLSVARGGAAIALTKGTSENGHSLTGETATAAAVVSGARTKGVTPGWNLRTVGSGGRAGRVQNECLVAMREVLSDASDDTIFPDS